MIDPTIRVESTISDPLNPASVIGFHGRDPRIGQNVVMMKESAVVKEQSEIVGLDLGRVGPVVKIPADATETIANHDAALFVLKEDTVLKMTPFQVGNEAKLHTFDRGDKTEDMSVVPLSSNNFHRFDRDDVEIKN